MASTYTPIATVTSSGSTSTVSFTSIPSTYTDLVVVCFARSSAATATSQLYMQFNSDTASNYSSTYLEGNGSVASSGRAPSTGYAQMGIISGASAASGVFGDAYFNVMNYANTTTYKTSLCRSGLAAAKTVATVGLWRSTSAISSIQIVCDSIANFAAGSTFTLYGIKAA